MAAPAVRPESATLPTNALGYVDIINFRPPVGALVPDRNDPEVHALLARTNERRAPEKPIRVHAVDGGFALADIESYRAWWALRHTVVRLLTALAVDHPGAARVAAARHVAAIEAEMNVRCRAPTSPGPAPSLPLQAVDATASGPSDPPDF